MIARLKQSGRFETAIFLSSISIFCFILSIARFLITGTTTFLFLNWNLFLAFIPWLSSTLITTSPLLQKRKAALLALLPIWMLFFPNSPYILTDLFHLRSINSAPIWFDLVLILSFAWAGLLYGFISLMDMEMLLRLHFKPATAVSLLISLLFLASFGVYLGRYLRWNSWDIIQSPIGLFSDITDRFINPFSHPRTWGMTLMMGMLLNFMFWPIRFLSKNYSS